MYFNMDEINNRFISYRKNNIILTGEQINLLKKYNINYQDCKDMLELINLIERNKDDDNFDDLDYLSIMLAETNYYCNTNK